MIPSHYLFDTFQGKRVHLGVSGSIAAYKSLDLLRSFLRLGLEVGVTLTDGGQQFLTPLAFSSLGAQPVHTNRVNPQTPFTHLEPQAADVFVVAPATANVLAKMAQGLADEILSCQLLAYAGPILVAPAMNPRMWSAKATQENWRCLLSRGVQGIGPACGAVACGDQGQGKMSAVHEIFIATLAALAPQDLAGLKIMLTVGPTREHYDAARFWSNPSTGAMGAALAVAAALRGALVTVIHGPLSLTWPGSITTIPVTSAQEMFEAAQDVFPSQDWGCFVAAVADYAPPRAEAVKVKKGAGPLSLTFEPNPDILATLSTAKKPHQRTIGFAAEGENLSFFASEKLVKKNLDLIVANPIDRSDAGFGAVTNKVLVMDRHGRQEKWPVLPKTEIAWRIWDWILLNSA